MSKLRKWLSVILATAALWLMAMPVHAADPLAFSVARVEVFRHVLEDDDWLILARLYLLPLTSTAYADVFEITTTDGDFDDPAVLTNRVHVTGAEDFLVSADTTDVTDYCYLEQDSQTVNCESTGLANATYDVTVTYRSGWSAYRAGDVFVRMIHSSTIVAERKAARLGYGLIGIYLTADDIDTYSLTSSWSAVDIGLRIIASPLLWSSPASIAVPINTWNSTSSMAATKLVLEDRLRVYLGQIEEDNDDLSPGDYVQIDYITDAGTTISREAFSMIQSSIPEAFASSRINPFPTAITTPSKSMVTAVETAAAGTNVFTAMEDVNPSAGLYVTLLGSLILAAVVYVATKSPYLGPMTWFATMMGGWLLFAIPFALVFIPAAAFSAIGFMYISKKVFDQ